MGNALGSHAGVNKFSAIYTSIACLPPHIASRLNSIILTCLLYTEDKKACGNEKVFKKLIQELNYLQTKEITVTVNKVEMNVKFQLILILGDNLGLNQIFGFTESFNSNYWCRICKANSNEAKKFTSEQTSVLRTVKNYEEDCQNISNSSAGIEEPCVFHKINDFHILENVSVDLMHDVIEGVCRYVMQLMIYTYIFKKQYFTLQRLNAIIKNFPLNSIDNINKPPPIMFNRLKQKLNLKMSASEMLCLVRYFSLFVGDLIPRDDEYWQLYSYLRQLIDILTSPRMIRQDAKILSETIENLNSLYQRLGDTLKPKFHNLTHILEFY